MKNACHVWGVAWHAMAGCMCAFVFAHVGAACPMHARLLIRACRSCSGWPAVLWTVGGRALTVPPPALTPPSFSSCVMRSRRQASLPSA